MVDINDFQGNLNRRPLVELIASNFQDEQFFQLSEQLCVHPKKLVACEQLVIYQSLLRFFSCYGLARSGCGTWFK